MKNNTYIHLGIGKKICPNTILMLKANINYTEIHLVDGSQYLSATTMGKLEKKLENFPFFRPNRSFLINLNFAKFEFEADEFLVNGKFYIAISRRRKLLTINHLLKYYPDLISTKKGQKNISIIENSIKTQADKTQ